MSIPALGGGAHQALQRALMDAADRTLADELGLLEGEDPATAPKTAAGTSTPSRAAVRRRAAGNPSAPKPAETTKASSRSNGSSTALVDDALVVELGEQTTSERLEVAGGWVTPAKRGPLETRRMPEPQSLPAEDVAGAIVGSAAEERGRRTAASEEHVDQRRAQQLVAQPPRPSEETSLERLIVVLKKTGIDFRDAYQVLREIRAGEPLPPRAELRARWQAADPAAWEERARGEQTQQGRRAEQPADPSRLQPTPQRSSDTDLRRTPVDDLIRDRSWHRIHDDTQGTHDTRDTTHPAPPAAPTLQSVTRETAVNQAYLAALSTAEFQRLVTVLGRNAPEWFWDLRGHRGLRGLAERPAIARLNTTRIAGTRLGAWILAALGMALLWYLGVRTGTWW